MSCPIALGSTNAKGQKVTEKLWAAIVAQENKTHRHLTPDEPVANGDIYGGDDWGFTFTIGSPQVDRPKAGEPAGPCAGGYRIRRPL